MSAATGKKPSRAYLHEIDMLRAVTALSVVAVHVTALSLFLNHSSLGTDVQNAVVTALHFTREVFIAITALVLVYGYVGKPFPFRHFWRRRGLGVLLPYIAWSLFYVAFSTPFHPVGHWLKTAGWDILMGSASFQLYYILLTIQFYLALPLILRWVRRLGRNPWRLLLGSFVLQLVMMYVDYNYVETGHFASTHLGHQINEYHWRFLPFYQLYVVCGALAALYLDQLRAFIRRHGRLIVAGMLFGLALLWGRYAYALGVEHRGQDSATAVFQPVVVFYSLTTILFLYWFTDRWALRRFGHGAPMSARSRFWQHLSDISFGIYLVHAFILTRVLGHIAPRLPVAVPLALRVALLWGIVAGSSVALCLLFLYTPLLSRLIGRPCMLPARWLDWPARRLAALRRGRHRPAVAPAFEPARPEPAVREVARLDVGGE
ncbi:MAG TPA: acyltransferase [Nitrolancea sp.]|nr:acyltransferase [Nitrolancea sp.]